MWKIKIIYFSDTRKHQYVNCFENLAHGGAMVRLARRPHGQNLVLLLEKTESNEKKNKIYSFLCKQTRNLKARLDKNTTATNWNSSA